MSEEISQTTQLPATIASIYVGDLAPSVTEPQLLDVFKTCGTVLGVRICRDIITRRSLGYGYVNFQNPADAEKAIETLNFKEVDGRHIRLMYQQRDPTARYSGSGNIFVKNLGDSVDSKKLHDLFKSFGAVLSCKVMSNEDGSSRRYGFVHFKSDEAAEKAITQMNGNKDVAAESESLYVSHFIRRNARIAALMLNFTNVYIKQVLPDIDQATIEKFFSKFGGITSSCTKKDRKGRVFAFCNFDTHENAIKAIENMHEKTVEGLTAEDEHLYVQRAQPRNERLVELRAKYMQRQSLGNNLYVRNFSPEFKDEDLKELFVEFGEIKSCRVMVDEKGHGRGFGFVCFANTEQANAALREMNGRMLNGKPLVVNIAQRRDQRYNMLQMQFQQRIQALMRQLPHMPFVAGMQQQPRRGPRAHQGGKMAVPPHRHMVGQVGSRIGTPQYTVTRTPQASPALAPDTPSLAPITEEELLAMPMEDQKVALGERLFVKVAEIVPDLAPKITGMFLEMEARDAYALLENPKKLEEKVHEAVCVIHAHQKELHK